MKITQSIYKIYLQFRIRNIIFISKYPLMKKFFPYNVVCLLAIIIYKIIIYELNKIK